MFNYTTSSLYMHTIMYNCIIVNINYCLIMPYGQYSTELKLRVCGGSYTKFTLIRFLKNGIATLSLARSVGQPVR